MVNLSFPNLMQEQDEIPILADEFVKNELLAAENTRNIEGNNFSLLYRLDIKIE